MPSYSMLIGCKIYLCLIDSLNPFHVIGLCLYPLETSEVYKETSGMKHADRV